VTPLPAPRRRSCCRSLDHRILAVVFVVVVASNLLVIRVGDLTAGTSPTIQRTTE
jgi:hypothetical protein